MLGLVTGTAKAEILSLVCGVLDLLAELLSCVLDLVGDLLSGLVEEITTLISDLVPFILELDVKSIIEILCIQV